MASKGIGMKESAAGRRELRDFGRAVGLRLVSVDRGDLKAGGGMCRGIRTVIEGT